MRWKIKTALLLSAYAPVLLLLAIQAWDLCISSAFVVLFLSILAITLAYLKFVRGSEEVPPRIQRIEQTRDWEAVLFVSGYLAPLLGANFEKLSSLAALAAFMTIVGFVHWRLDLLHVNFPLLAIGYRILSVEVGPDHDPDKRDNIIVLAKNCRTISQLREKQLKPMGDGTWIAIEEAKT